MLDCLIKQIKKLQQKSVTASNIFFDFALISSSLRCIESSNELL